MTVAELERRKELDDIKTQMDTVHGRRVMHRILKTSGCLDRPMILTELGASNYYEGKRSIGFDFMADVMDVAPKKFPVMIMEAKERAEKQRILLEKEREREAEANEYD